MTKEIGISDLTKKDIILWSLSVLGVAFIILGVVLLNSN